MPPCLTTTPIDDGMMMCDDSTCASSIFLAVSGDGTCQKHPNIRLCNEDGLLTQSCPECDEELQSQCQSMEDKRRELDLQLAQLSQDDDDNSLVFDDVNNSDEASEEKVPVQSPRFGLECSSDDSSSTVESLKNKITLMQLMNDWTLQQKETEITVLRSQAENYQKQLLQKEVENALLRERLKQQEERIQRRTLRSAEGKLGKGNNKKIQILKERLKQQEERMQHKSKERKTEREDNQQIHIQELIVKVGGKEVEIDATAVQDANKAANNAASTTDLSLEEKGKEDTGCEIIGIDENNIGLSAAHVGYDMKNVTNDEPLLAAKLSSRGSPVNDIKFVPQYKSSESEEENKAATCAENAPATTKASSIQKSEDSAETQLTKNTIGQDDAEKGVVDYTNVDMLVTKPRSSVQASEQTEQTKNITFRLNDDNDHNDEDESDSKVLQWRPPPFRPKPIPSQNPAQGSMLKVPVDTLKTPSPQQTSLTAAAIALNTSGTFGLPSKEDIKVKDAFLPQGIPFEIDQDDSQSINEELTLATGFDNTDDCTFATSTCDEERLDVINKKLADPYGDRGIYTGVLLRSTGMPHGLGRMVYDDDGRTYDGEWRHGRWHGFGQAVFLNGDTYEGEYKFDQRHGRGKYCWKDGRLYDGEFKEDRRQGKGYFKWPDGATYDGDFVQGKREGYGQYNFMDGGYYKGSWLDGRYEGFGECIWNDGRSYKGEWRAGMAHGRGAETYPDGSVRHNGEWFEDTPITYSNGSVRHNG
mmetsp:Transcript_31613/g.46650  ORF Transcript_31613/g.46650 Transcript_31613/m.46650 type:complete len:757 (+) Transcript_31613:66-2336(+)